MTREEKIESLSNLDKDQLKTLLSTGISRQLRWAVFTVSSLLTLVSLYNEIRLAFPEVNLLSSGNTGIMTYFSPVNMWSTIGYSAIFLIATFLILYCENRLIRYYQYVSNVEKVWLKKEGIKLNHNDVFSIGGNLDGLLHWNHSTFVVNLITLVVIVPMFVLPLLI